MKGNVIPMTTVQPVDQPGGAQPGRLRRFHPGWYGAVMGTAIVGIIACQNPGEVEGLRDAAQAFGGLMGGLAAVLVGVLANPSRPGTLAAASPGAGPQRSARRP